MLSIIVAIDVNYAIGRKGDLLCHLPDDLKHFKAITSHHTVIMGERTYLSLPKHPLPNRRNIVITDNPLFADTQCEVVHSIAEALSLVTQDEEAFVIGGGMVYRQMLPLADKLYLTHIHHRFDDADTFFPIDMSAWHCINREEHQADEAHAFAFTFAEYTKKE